MPHTQAKQRIYLEVAKAKKADLDSWRRGVSIERRAGAAIEDLSKKACQFRLRLAKEFFRAAQIQITQTKPNYRIVIGRGYYSMYHNVRALVYFSHGGDDFEAHSTVAKEIPEDFPDKADWQNKFRIARLERNRADYDPFPLANKSYKASAENVFNDTKNLVSEVTRYLRSKGLAI